MDEATIWGPVLGALFVGFVPVLATAAAEYLPFIAEPGSTHGITVTDFGLIIYGVLIIVFLLFRREGLISFFPRHRRPRAAKPPSVASTFPTPTQEKAIEGKDPST